jgi:hypothetical protein
MADQEFRVVLHGVELSDEHAQRITSSIQKAIGHELATIDLGGDALAHIPNPGWLGIWIQRLNRKGLEQLGVPVELERRE